MGGTQALHYNHTVAGKVIIQFIPGAGPPKLNEVGTTGALNLYPPCFSIILDSKTKQKQKEEVLVCVGGRTHQDSVTDHSESLRDTGLTKESAPTSGNVPGPTEQIDRLFTSFNYSVLLPPCFHEFVL